MEKEVLSVKQGICLVVMFIMGSTLVVGTATEANHDNWIAILLGILFAAPMIMVYARIQFLFPGEDIFEILITVFGKVLGKVIGLLLTWYAFHLGALVTRNFSEFISVVAMPETPAVVPVMILMLLCIWGVKLGIEVLGRWSVFMLPILLFIIFAVVLMSLTLADLDNLKPVFHKNTKKVLEGAFSVFSFPFVETIIFMMIGFHFREQKSVYPVYLKGLLYGGLIVFVVGIRNMLVMGPTFIEHTYFPSYAAVSLINIGDFLQRIEIFVSVVFLFSGFIKITLCLLGTCRGLANLLNLPSYRPISAPVAMLMVALSMIIYANIMEMVEWAFKIYKFYALPFQVLLPLLLWIVAEIKYRRKLQQEAEF